MGDFERLRAQLDRIEEILGRGESALTRQAPSVSGWSVAQQLDHVLHAAEQALALALEPGDPLPRPLNLRGRIVLGLGWFPRGVAKSPKRFLPRPADAVALAGLLATVRSLAARLEAAPERLADRRPFVPHPYFAGMTAAQTVRMVVVHNHHHLAIVRDITAAANVAPPVAPDSDATNEETSRRAS